MPSSSSRARNTQLANGPNLKRSRSSLASKVRSSVRGSFSAEPRARRQIDARQRCWIGSRRNRTGCLSARRAKRSRGFSARGSISRTACNSAYEYERASQYLVFSCCDLELSYFPCRFHFSFGCARSNGELGTRGHHGTSCARRACSRSSLPPSIFICARTRACAERS